MTTFIQAQVTKATVEDQEWNITRSANTKLTKLMHVRKFTELREQKRIVNTNKVTKALYTLQKHKIIDNGDRNLTKV